MVITHEEHDLEADGIHEIRASKETRGMVNRVQRHLLTQQPGWGLGGACAT